MPPVKIDMPGTMQMELVFPTKFQSLPKSAPVLLLRIDPGGRDLERRLMTITPANGGLPSRQLREPLNDFDRRLLRALKSFLSCRAEFSLEWYLRLRDLP